MRGLDSLEALQFLAADDLQRGRVVLRAVHRAHVGHALWGERVELHRLLSIQGAAGFEALDDTLISPHESANVCGDAEKISSSLWHNARSFAVSLRSAGSGSIAGRRGGWYWPCWAAQPVIASAHAALSSFNIRSIFLLLSKSGCVLLEQAGAEAGFDRQGSKIGSFARLLAGGDCGRVASLPLLGAVVAHTEPDAQQQQDHRQHAAQQPVDRAHAAAFVGTSYWAIFRPPGRLPITAISLPA